MKIKTSKLVLPLLGITLFIISGCSVTNTGDKVTFEPDKQYMEENLCMGMYEISFPLRNGSGMTNTSYYELVDGRRFNSHEDFLKAENARHSKYLKRYNEYYRRYNKYYNEYYSAKFKEFLTNSDVYKEKFDFNNYKSIFDRINKKTDAFKEKTHKEFDSKYDRPAPKPFVSSDYSFISKSYKTPLLGWKRLSGIQKHYASQSSPELCWAASLETAFRHIGRNYPQKKIYAALEKRCAAKLSETATLNQIFFAASDVHLSSGGQWIGKFPSREQITVDLGELASVILGGVANYQPQQNTNPVKIENGWNLDVMGQQMVSFPSKEFSKMSIPWTTTYKDGRESTKGKIKLITSVAELSRVIYKNYPVIVGRKTKQGGHTVVISGIRIQPGGTYDAVKKLYSLDYRTNIKRIEYLDPLLGAEPLYMQGDEFLSTVLFAFYIDP